MAILLWIAIIVLVIYVVSVDEIKSIKERDPAAKSFLEVLLLYPGLHALIIYRVTHKLWQIGLPLIPRWLSQLGRFFTGIEIHPGATIGKGIFIDHGMGVVIGETTVIGSNVTLFQGVTLGGTGKEKGKRHPTLGNNVVVGAGAKILGNIHIGDNVSVGANSVVLHDVPPNATVVGVPGRVAKREGRRLSGANIDYYHLPDPLTQALERLQHEIDKIENELKDK